MLAHRLRRWPNIEPALAQRIVFAGMLAMYSEQLSTHNSESFIRLF